MEINPAQFERIKEVLPRQRGNVRVENLVLLNALFFVLANGCKWRGLPAHFGPRHTVYMRLSRWSKAGVIERVFARLQQEQILAVRLEVLSLDRTSIKVHPDGTGARKKTGRSPSARAGAAGPPSCIWYPRLHGVR